MWLFRGLRRERAQKPAQVSGLTCWVIAKIEATACAAAKPLPSSGKTCPWNPMARGGCTSRAPKPTRKRAATLLTSPPPPPACSTSSLRTRCPRSGYLRCPRALSPTESRRPRRLRAGPGRPGRRCEAPRVAARRVEGAAHSVAHFPGEWYHPGLVVEACEWTLRALCGTLDYASALFFFGSSPN